MNIDLSISSLFRDLSHCVAETDQRSAGRRCHSPVERGAHRREADCYRRCAQAVLSVTAPSNFRYSPQPPEQQHKQKQQQLQLQLQQQQQQQQQQLYLEDQKQRISDGTHRMLLCFSITATCSLSYVHKLINQMKSTPPPAAAAATESKTTSGCS